MKNKDIIITINNLSDISKLKELGINRFAFPLKGFCVGIPNTFLLEEIKENGYLYINRILDNEGIDNLRNVLDNLLNNIIGIIFDDLGIINLVKDKNIEKILYLSHFNTNSKSIKYYLEYVDNVIISTDITLDEIKYIIDNVNKPLCLFTYGYVGVMYSRRLLIDNYCKFYNKEYENPIKIHNDGNGFIVYENEYGTYFYHDKLFVGNVLLELPCKYYFFNSVFLNIEDIKNILEGNTKYLDISTGFLYKPTIYKLKGDENA